jgi:hypothetical protein
LSSIELVSKFLQVVELNLMMNEGAAEQVNTDKLLKMIRWMEDNYNGEIVDWGVIIEILAILFEPNEWMNNIKSLPNDCFWLMQI